MIDKLNIVEQRFNEVSDLIIQPDIITDKKRYVSLNKEYKDLGLIIEKKKMFEELLSNVEEAEKMSKSEGFDKVYSYMPDVKLKYCFV